LTPLDQLSVEEKAALTAGDSMWRVPGVPRLGLRGLKMSDGPSGVRGSSFIRRSLVMPCGTALGATWNPALLHRVGAALGAEARDKDVDVLLGPTVNIVRTPLAGRTFECYSEDPCLSAGLAVAYLRGVQAEGVGCCIKHFACNDQEFERMTISAQVDARALREIHLPVFEAAVAAGVWAVMSAYNRLGGTFCSENPDLLDTILRNEWGFDGVVVSDWFGTHSTVPAALAGLDIEMPGPAQWLGPVLAGAVRRGEVATSVLDDMAGRVLLLMQRCGTLEGSRVDHAEREDDIPERRRVARAAAVESMVLLTNDGLLPLDPVALRRVAVIGRSAAGFEVGGGGSATVNPQQVVPPLDALVARFGAGVEVIYEPGCRIATTCPTIDSRHLDGGGLRVDLWDNLEFDGTPVSSEGTAGGRLLWIGPPSDGVSAGAFSARATTTFIPPHGGRWRLSLESAGRSRLFLDETVVLDNWAPTAGTTFMGLGSAPVEVEIELEAGRRYGLVVELRVDNKVPLAGARIGAEAVLPIDALAAAERAAAGADVAIVVVGTTPDHESEGFDRSGLGLPGEQDELVARVVAANPRSVVVVNAGSPVTMPWAQAAGAVVVAWFPGEEGGQALVDVLVGDANPSGRLPVTFPARINDTPAYPFYPGSEGRVTYGEGTLVGYRHYDARRIAPAFCFGHGLSYTTVTYGPLLVEVNPDGTVDARVTVTHSGGPAGAEVVQLYVAPDAPDQSVPDRSAPVRPDAGPTEPRAPKQLRAFAKVTLEPGVSSDVLLRLGWRDFAHWDETAHTWVVDPGPFALAVGASSLDIRSTATVQIPAH
jgi:beta-glucosidase